MTLQRHGFDDVQAEWYKELDWVSFHLLYSTSMSLPTAPKDVSDHPKSVRPFHYIYIYYYIS